MSSGSGFFVAGLYWIAAALFVDIARFWWALPFAVLGLPAYLAFYPAAALGVTSLATMRLRLPAGARICLFAVGVERGRMGARALADRVAVEPRRLCLVGRLPGLAGDAAKRRLGRDLRAEPGHGAGRRAAGAARNPVAAADDAGRAAPRPALGAALLILVPAAAGAIRLAAGAGRRDRNHGCAWSSPRSPRR